MDTELISRELLVDVDRVSVTLHKIDTPKTRNDYKQEILSRLYRVTLLLPLSVRKRFGSLDTNLTEA